MKTWKARVQSVYDSLEELESADRCHNVAKRCGYRSAKTMWRANPWIGGSVDPRDFGRVRMSVPRPAKDDVVAGVPVYCYDNGGKTVDRYTVAYPASVEHNGQVQMVGMSAHPFHPQGVGQHTTGKLGRHLGKRIRFQDLPADCQKLVIRDCGGTCP